MRMRKYLCVLISIILSLTLFCACSNGQNSAVSESTGITSSTSSEQTTDAAEVTVTATEAQITKAEKKKADKEKAKKETTKKGEKTSTTAKSVSKKDNKETTAAKKSSSNSKNNSKDKKKYVKTEAEKSTIEAKADKPKTTSPKENNGKVTHTTSSEINCSITIECKSILDNMDDLKKGHESYVPKNGIMLENYKTTLKSGSTVYDLLKKACNDKGITYTAKDTMYSVYIVGINNIDEFDCGKQSGWMYNVNGKYPNISVDSKKLKDGDKVVFTYTCSYKK